MSKTTLVTGASTGIGLATSIQLAKSGYRVYAGLRNLAKSEGLKKAAEEAGVQVDIVQLDVTDESSIDAAFGSMGDIDILINNAGIGGSTPLELTPMDEHRGMFETNYFGAIACIQKVLPGMRERQHGTIVNITSVAGLHATPNQVAYSASKFALEAAGEALAHEVIRFGVRIVNVEPGVIMTNIFENSAEATRYDKTSPYQPLMRRSGKMYSAGFRRAVQPIVVAETIQEAIETDEYRLRWPVGEDAVGLYKGGATVSDEDKVALGGDLSDEEYNARFKEYFDIEL
ncbi:MAG: SDR family oxidoreductase [Pseudomonadota bacterium]